MTQASPDEIPPYRYTAQLAGEIEARWQEYWAQNGSFDAPNPAGPLSAEAPADLTSQPKRYVMDMFPYPSGAGLHVGHPLGYIATDSYSRYSRMLGYQVLHPMGFDAFGLPAEQYAVQTGQHPQITTEENIGRFREQLSRLGLGYDSKRWLATTDPGYVRWTQWIFLQIYNSWYDVEADRARPIADLVTAYETGAKLTPDGRPWVEMSQDEQRESINQQRLAYLSEAPVNWCPGLGTVLANEEVTAEGRSERGNFPVFPRSLKQWMMRITAYADRLLGDLDDLDWPEPIKIMQRNWIGRSEGAYIDFHSETDVDPVRVFTTRHDTIFGCTFVVLAPEHPLVDQLVADHWPEGTEPQWTDGYATPREAVAAYRREAAAKSDAERTEVKHKTGVGIGAFVTNPANGARVPLFIGDYVLAGYGTGAVMGVPGEDDRDWEFAENYHLTNFRTVQPPEGFTGAYEGDGVMINSASEWLDLNGRRVPDAKRAVLDWLVANGRGEAAITYRLRDWLFSRQRYWGEPFPIVFDEAGNAHALPDAMLPVELPEVDDFSPKTFAPDDANSSPEPPLGRATDWRTVELDLGDGPRQYHRDLNTMPNWAGSCWYELRYLDPANPQVLVETEAEKYWMGPRGGERDPGGVDLYVGGVEHAVLHLLYARFWHKVLFDLGYISSREPFRRLFNQGYIQAYAYTDARGAYVPAEEVEETDGGYTWQGQPVKREYGKMGKSLKNVVTPDDMCAAYGADTFRVYEMSMGPLDVSRPWETRAVVGSQRFLQRVWRSVIDENTGTVRVSDEAPDVALRRLLHQTIEVVRADYDELRFNTAIARLIQLNNALTGLGSSPREIVEPLVLMLAPVAPHLAEELWQRLGHTTSLSAEPFPVADPTWLREETTTYPVQVNGKVRGRITVPTDADEATVRQAAMAEPTVAAALAGADPKRVIVVPGRLVSLVL